MNDSLDRPNKVTLSAMAGELEIELWKAMELVKWVRLRITEDLNYPYEERWKWLIEKVKEDKLVK